MLKPSRVVYPQVESAPGPPARCAVCYGPTREKKPYCPEHLDRLPYVQEVLNGIAEREREIATSQFRVPGPSAEDVITRLQVCPATFERVNRDTGIPVEPLRVLIKKMVRAKLVRIVDKRKLYLR